MVNMNEAGNKEDGQNEVNGITEEEASAITSLCDEKENTPANTHSKPNNILYRSDENDKIPIANGVFSKLNSIPLSSNSTWENNEPSSSKSVNTAPNQSGTFSSLGNETCCQENNKECFSENKEDNHQKTESNSTRAQNQSNQRGRQTCNYEENSSSEDEECCIYTYKGDSNQMADLPSSFFRLDLMSSRPNGNSGNSSPDMDYLEMDFDPGPSNDRDSSSLSDSDGIRGEEDILSVEVPAIPLPEESQAPTPEPAFHLQVKPPTSLSPLSTPSPVLNTKSQFSPNQPSSSGVVWSRAVSSEAQPPVQSESCPSVPLVLPLEAQQQANSYCFCLQPSASSSVSMDENFNDGDTESMIWKEEEAKEKQVNQIGTSLCGATAVINTLLALNVPYSLSTVKQFVATRFRNETSSIPEYLMSRSVAGVTHVDMIHGLQAVSQDAVYARFFHMYPHRNISLTNWLSHWIKKGAVPILTLNTQRSGSGEEVADCWHHQMAYGVSVRGVHLTNPLETQSEAQLRPQLASPSLLLVRCQDVLSRWTPDTPLHPLASSALPLWRHLNVLGQVVNVVREGKVTNQSPQHITIPASYSSGVTLAILRTNPACEELRLAHELPVDPFAPW